MATKTINQEGVACDATGCNKFFLGEKPKSWKKLKITGTIDDEFDACTVKHAKEIAATYISIS